MNNIEEQNINKEDNTNNELAIFIDKNYEKITTKKFNFASCFFTSLYMFYRKMIIPGTIVALLNILVIIILPIFMNSINYTLNSIIIYTILIVICIMCGLLTNKIYVNYAKKQIAKIQKQNNGKTPTELNNLYSEKGGTSIGTLFLGIIIAIILTGIISYISSLFGYNQSITIIDTYTEKDEGTPITDINPNKYLTSGTYKGYLFYNASIKIKDKLEVTIPSALENQDEESTYEYTYSCNNECNLNIAVPGGYESISTLFRNMSTYYNQTVNTDTINDIEWKWLSTENETNKKYFYGTTKDNIIYLVEYEIIKDNTSNCETYLEEIINSINLK